MNNPPQGPKKSYFKPGHHSRTEKKPCSKPGHTQIKYGKSERSQCWDCTKERNRKTQKARHEQRRRNAIDTYGGQCACCGESDIRFLAIDHVNEDGSNHRKEIKASGSTTTYRWLESNNYPAGFQVLCHNCNYAKHVYGTCPHKEVMSNESSESAK